MDRNAFYCSLYMHFLLWQDSKSKGKTNQKKAERTKETNLKIENKTKAFCVQCPHIVCPICLEPSFRHGHLYLPKFLYHLCIALIHCLSILRFTIYFLTSPCPRLPPFITTKSWGAPLEWWTRTQWGRGPCGKWCLWHWLVCTGCRWQTPSYTGAGQRDKRWFQSGGSCFAPVPAGPLLPRHSQLRRVGSIPRLHSLPGSELRPGPGFGSGSVVPRLPLQSTGLGCVSPCVSPDTSPEMRGG